MLLASLVSREFSSQKKSQLLSDPQETYFRAALLLLFLLFLLMFLLLLLSGVDTKTILIRFLPKTEKATAQRFQLQTLLRPWPLLNHVNSPSCLNSISQSKNRIVAANCKQAIFSWEHVETVNVFVEGVSVIDSSSYSYV